MSKHADQVSCGIFQQQEAIKYKHGVCEFLFSRLSASICFFFLLDSETYWDACIAKQIRAELFIDDSLIKAPCRTRTWRFLTVDLQRTDTNALMSSKLVYKLGQVCGPFLL